MRNYLLHTVTGISLRDLARSRGCHASTILRQVRKCEARRDDPLFDAGLDALARTCLELIPPCKESLSMTEPSPERANLSLESLLRRLCERGAYMLVSPRLDMAAIFKPGPGGAARPIARTTRSKAQDMALRDWIAGEQLGSVGRYAITGVGRAALRRMLAERGEARAPGGFAEAQSPFAAQHSLPGTRQVMADDGSGPVLLRCNLAESPLTLLARRKRKCGSPFLTADMVAAGERLREDFELAQLGPRVAQNWDRFLTAASRGGFRGGDPCGGPEAARSRVSEALAALGPGLADITFRVCCFLDGLEAAEKRLGLSARAGKEVLRIALQRLAGHYGLPGAWPESMAC